MISEETIQRHLKIALTEIGAIEPWWSEEDKMFVFEHVAYPWVIHADPVRQEAQAGYLRALTGFMAERLNGTVADSQNRSTPGRAGISHNEVHLMTVDKVF